MASSLNALGARRRETIGGRIGAAEATLSAAAEEFSTVSSQLQAVAASAAQPPSPELTPAVFDGSPAQLAGNIEQTTDATAPTWEVSAGVQAPTS